MLEDVLRELISPRSGPQSARTAQAVRLATALAGSGVALRFLRRHWMLALLGAFVALVVRGDQRYDAGAIPA